MDIALVTSLVSPIRRAEANGPHAVVLDLARGLAERGHATRIYAAAGSEAHGVEIVELPVDPEAAGAAVRPGHDPTPEALAALRRGFATLFDAVRRDRPDVVSQHAFDAAALRLAESLPVLHTLHLPPDAAVATAARRTASPLASVSRYAVAAWESVLGRRVALLPNGVRALEGAVDEHPDPVALIAGRISPEKGTHVAIQAARAAGLSPLVVGDAYDADYLERAVAPLLRDGEWIGPVARHVLSRLMAGAAVLLMPVAWNEPFGLVAAEAQMAGCPVVAYGRGALPEVVAEGIGGFLVEPGDERALVAAVPRALALDRSRVRDDARRRLGIERMLDAYEAALLDVARRRAVA